MGTYLALNLAFLVAVAFIMIARPARLNRRHLATVMTIMLLATVIFDSLMVHFDLMAYSPAKTTGITLGLAPIEDFAYTIVAVLLISYIWKKLERRQQ